MDCPLMIRVQPNANHSPNGGFACAYTGGHCRPCDECEARREYVGRECDDPHTPEAGAYGGGFDPYNP